MWVVPCECIRSLCLFLPLAIDDVPNLAFRSAAARSLVVRPLLVWLGLFFYGLFFYWLVLPLARLLVPNLTHFDPNMTDFFALCMID